MGSSQTNVQLYIAPIMRDLLASVQMLYLHWAATKRHYNLSKLQLSYIVGSPVSMIIVPHHSDSILCGLFITFQNV